MKLILFSILIVVLSATLKAQPVGYYNGTEGKTGEELKAALHNIIDDHLAWEYSYSKNVFALSDRDPATPGNVLLVYTGRSEPWNNYGTGSNQITREHVWAKSHGNFGITKPTGSDYHSLKPADGSVNVDRSNKDFDICQGVAGAQQHSEATECYFTPDAWEPRDAVKGDIARIIFYMATRYEGGQGEIDLEVSNTLNNSPQPLHGKLSALYQWNSTDLPDAFEMNRNNVISTYQKNRNPYIDNPNWVQMIWGEMPADPIAIGNMQQSVEIVTPSTPVTITATAQGTGTITTTLKWGTTYSSLTNSIPMTVSSGTYSATIPAQPGNTDVYLKVEATNGINTCSSVIYSYRVQPTFAGTITPISQIQGQTSATPFLNQVVTVSGVVTGNYGQGYFVQDAAQAWSGLYIYDIGRNPEIGDSVIVTGKVVEYYELTEMTEVSHFQIVERNKPLPAPIVFQAGNDREPYESVLVRIVNGQVTSVDEGYGLWKINDGTGDIMVHNTMIYSHTPVLGQYHDIIAPLTWDFGEWKLELRSADDVMAGSDLVKPLVSELVMTAPEYIWLYFNEPISGDNASQLSNYSFNTSIQVVSANRHAIQTHVIILRVTSVTVGVHELTVQNIADLSGNVMDPQSISFFSPYVDIAEVESEGGIKMYPNPTITGVITMENTREVLSVDVFDLTGRILHHIDNNDRLQTIVIGGLPHGILAVVLHTSDGQSVKKQIVVQ